MLQSLLLGSVTLEQIDEATRLVRDVRNRILSWTKLDYQPDGRVDVRAEFGPSTPIWERPATARDAMRELATFRDQLAPLGDAIEFVALANADSLENIPEDTWGTRVVDNVHAWVRKAVTFAGRDATPFEQQLSDQTSLDAYSFVAAHDRVSSLIIRENAIAKKFLLSTRQSVGTISTRNVNPEETLHQNRAIIGNTGVLPLEIYQLLEAAQQCAGGLQTIGTATELPESLRSGMVDRAVAALREAYADGYPLAQKFSENLTSLRGNAPYDFPRTICGNAHCTVFELAAAAFINADRGTLTPKEGITREEFCRLWKDLEWEAIRLREKTASSRQPPYVEATGFPGQYDDLQQAMKTDPPSRVLQQVIGAIVDAGGSLPLDDLIALMKWSNDDNWKATRSRIKDYLPSGWSVKTSKRRAVIERSPG